MGALSGDRIELRGLRAVGTHGVLAEEQLRGQPFEVDLDLEADLRAAGGSDRLDDTIDYGGLSEAVAAIITGERIAEAALADARVTSVAVTVRKLRPPVPVDLASAGVRIVRRPVALGGEQGT